MFRRLLVFGFSVTARQEFRPLIASVFWASSWIFCPKTTNRGLHGHKTEFCDSSTRI